MARGEGLGRDFAWLWRAFAVSTLGTWLAFDALPILAVRVVHASAAQVSLLAAAGAVAAAALALPLGPWVEYRPKRRLMIRADLLRFLAMLSVPIAYATGTLSYLQLIVVTVVVAVADIVFTAAAGANLKSLVGRPHLLEANRRFETVTWVSTAIGPPAGGALIGALGPVVTILLDAVSYLLSALGIRAIARTEPAPPVRSESGSRLAEIGEGWRAIAADRELRLLFANGVLVGGLIMATSPLLIYLMLHDLGFSTLQYGLAFGVPCLGGILGARLSAPLTRRYGQRRILLGFGVGRVLWLAGLAFTGRGTAGLLVVMATELGIITCMGVYNPVMATRRLERTADDKVARVLTTWRVGSRTSIAGATALWGALAGLTSARTAIAVAGVLLIATSFLLPWRTGDDAPRGGEEHGPADVADTAPEAADVGSA
ncbi:MFS transporter [Actinoallomurus rhizosphaericola]|uniref:MFS transporter n=1 Tax=Actinoallomurus rhizosphaericola TaxID=2952536 RepID=UPI0020908502|nr:MFS transporter [Actinoallomurus rhizosphaericola]MCO5991994.1 MFS transporter [Actinoallomurus rhizosphaericola]